MKQPEYVPFHIALKAAIEDGATIENKDHGYKFKFIDNRLKQIHKFSEVEYDQGINWFVYYHEWRIIPKPKRVEFECNIKEGKFSDNSGRFPIIDYSRSVENELMHFIGKRTRVTIEEIED